jgi:hypothetical protein
VLCFTIVSGIVGGASAIELVIVVGLIGVTTALSFAPTAAAKMPSSNHPGA